MVPPEGMVNVWRTTTAALSAVVVRRVHRWTRAPHLCNLAPMRRARLVVGLPALALAVAFSSAACEGCLDVYVGQPDGDTPEPEPNPPPDSGGDGDGDGGVFDGDFTLSSTSVAELAAYRRVTGDLLITGVEAASLSLAQSALVVDGDFVVQENGQLTSLVTGGLSSVGGDVRVTENALLQSFSTTNLVSVGGDVRIVDDPALSFVGMSNLGEVGGSITLYDGRNLRFDTLSYVDGSVTVGGPSPETRPAVVTLSLPALESIGADLVVLGLAQLVTLQAPVLNSVSGVFVVRENPLLDVLELPALAHVGVSLCICQNETLDACDASSVVTNLEEVSDLSIDTSGNDDTLPCE